MTLTVNNFMPKTVANTNCGQKRRNKVSAVTKIASAAGSAIGITAALIQISKKADKNAAGHFRRIINTIKKAEFNDKNVIFISSASTAGGFAGGTLTDTDNIKSKAKEGMVQLIGNYIIPSLFVGGGIHLNKKILDSRTNFKNSPKILKLIQFSAGIISLIAGVICGNLLSEKINTSIFGEKSQRPLNWKDWAEQIDNLCLVTSMSTTGSNLAKTVSKVIPVAHFMPGYLTGIKQEENSKKILNHSDKYVIG